MVVERIERLLPAEVNLLRDMSHGESRTGRADPRLADLMRLADDPLLIQDFLHRQREQIPAPTDRVRDQAASVITIPLQGVLGARKEQIDPKGGQRYLPNESQVGTSASPFVFEPTILEREDALDGDHPEDVVYPYRLPPPVLIMLVVATALAASLLLSLG